MESINERTNTPGWLWETRWQIVLLALVLSLTYFVNLGSLEPSLMEARNFITAREMVGHGNWLVPTMNGYVRLAKPPLPTWLTAWAGLAAGNIENLAALRLPAALMSSLLVFFFYALVRRLTTDKLLPFLATLILATSWLLINIGRQGTWDIYCHSFMVGALWLMVTGWQQKKAAYGWFIGAGLLLGCSFISKGPVAFYTLLVPFLVSYSYGYGLRYDHWRGVVLLVLVCVAVSVTWPLYIYLAAPESLALTVQNEGQAWVNRHVQPLWYYWSFPVQSGIWALLAAAGLVLPQARQQIQRYGRYKFVVLWVLLTVLLLSLLPEKKERYLLPAMVPLALLTACYVRYLLDSFSSGTATRLDRGLVLTTALLLAAVAFGLPVGYYLFVLKTGAGSGLHLLGVTVAGGLAGIAVLYFARTRQLLRFLMAAVALHTLALLVIIPNFEAATFPPGSTTTLQQVRQKKAIRNLDFYAVGGMNPKYIWEVGKPVDTLRILNNRLQLPSTLPAVVFATERLTQAQAPSDSIRVQALASYTYNPKEPGQRYYLHILSKPVPARSPRRLQTSKQE
ncbi:ArnT family glycosyltransferase [Pontibacter liquoris]|uniref:ArnT family glycosyltransferase n=1 Tax=Pontibacter liquoris TaxID=2905677 RepID=UPI001FA7354C|nr:glycosyltransferase family 39 protein [Pontibacter liquoris]